MMLTALDAIKAAYPARYYASYDENQTQGACDMWTGRMADGRSLGAAILDAEPASLMIALTEEQFNMMASVYSVPVKDGKLLYPARYYAGYDTSAAQPTQVTAWFDTWGMTSVVGVPDSDDLIAVSATDWHNSSFRASVGKGVYAGEIIDFTPPPLPVPVLVQAKSELTDWIASQASMAAAMGETFTDDMKSYVKAVKAMADGSDVTSEKLPDRPTSILS
ncbi:hypothetical protein [Acetobacter indonesiensis]|uniref:hypothetical protein n=1 Tax=Acetobacter indonesiensis TaxID=104101 RepID=UPI0020A4E918|nr:hypothetical protein [Acetobacter indonesiensis]MCP1231715.1 hypothetical protein [Acetobacter indonesiensis]